MPQVTAMLPHHCKLTLIPHTIQRDQMPLSKILVPPQAMPSFERKKVIKHTSAIQPHKETVARNASSAAQIIISHGDQFIGSAF